MKTVGVLALQGDFEAHCRAIARAGGDAREVRTAGDLAACGGLVLPGGESTTMWKLLEIERLIEPVRRFASEKPVYGSCAGAILLAREVTQPAQPSLGLMDIDVVRNAYGRQIDSRIATICVEGGGLEAVFIRAPVVSRVGPEPRILGKYNGDPVWVEHGRHMVTTFHPELTADLRVHRRFLEKIQD
jgi:pyridoxal 5'-phosphate synthase pdxT subunit